MLIKKFILFLISLSIIFGSILFAATAESEPVLDNANIKKGDANCDGYIRADDSRLTLRVAAGVERQLDSVALWAGDMNDDGIISASDSRHILRTSARLIPPEDVSYKDVVPQVPDELPPQGNVSGVIEPSESVTAEPTQPFLDTSYCSAIIPPTDFNNKNFSMPSFPEYNKEPGTFAFTTFGYGHGVGMSQYGAIYLADSGYNYKQILNYYYKQTKMMHADVPETLLMPDFKTEVDTREIIGRITQQEIAGVTKRPEALKAQVVAAYTYSLHNKGCVNGLAFSSSADKVRDDVWAAVDEVLGEYLVDANGRPINSLFFALSAGRTTLASTVWGGADVPSLTIVDSPFDRSWSNYNKYIEVKTYTTDEIILLTERFNQKVRAGKIRYCDEIVLQENPGEWFKILETDGAVNSEIGYVTKMQIGNQTINSCAGQRLRADFFEYSIRSHCLVVEYFKKSPTNIFG